MFRGLRPLAALVNLTLLALLSLSGGAGLAQAQEEGAISPANPPANPPAISPAISPANPPAANAPANASPAGPRGARALSPADREALRQLGEEQRKAMNGGQGARSPGPALPGMTPLERRRLREQLREEHERRERRRRG
jgi:hypothetical protein